MPSEFIIFPCNGNGIEAMDCIDPAWYDFVGFVDDNFETKQGAAGKWRVEGRSLLEQYPGTFLLAVPVCSESFQMRDEYIAGMGIDENRFISVVHPTAVFGLDELKRKNYLVMDGVVISFTAWIVDHLCILSNTMIRHDAGVRGYSQNGSSVKITDGYNVGNYSYIERGRRLVNEISKGDLSFVRIRSTSINVFRRIQELLKILRSKYP
jgi:hypothetical protein